MKALVLALSLVSTQAFAGAWNQQIECTNKSGSIKLSGNVPGDIDEFTLNVTVKSPPHINSKFTPSMELYSRTNQTTEKQEKNGNVAVVEDLDQKVFTVKAVDLYEQGLIELYAYPNSLKIRKGGRGSSTSFLGHLTVSNENGMEKAVVFCETHY